MSTSAQDDETTPPNTFKEAFAVLQKHADTLRRQQEPNIDELVSIVTESVNAYNVCKERIQAVEQALERTLAEAEEDSGEPVTDNQPEVRATTDKPEAKSGAEQAAKSAPRASDGDAEFDDDIPF